MRRLGVMLTAALLSACSTYTVAVIGAGSENMNPNRAGGSSDLCVYAFFLQKTEAFEQKDKAHAEYLTKEVVADNKVPAFLEKEAVAVKRIDVPRAAAGKTTSVRREFEVPSEVTHVGLVAAFQSHRDNDPDEVWKLVLPVTGSAVSFEVSGKRLAAATPKKKEAPRADSDG